MYVVANLSHMVIRDRKTSTSRVTLDYPFETTRLPYIAADY